MKKPLLLIISFLVSIIAYSQSHNNVIDAKATPETRALYSNLKELSKKHILFGHQHATEYGHGWVENGDRSDVKSVTGSHPAVIGVDISGLSGRPDSVIEKEKKSLRKNIIATYDRGGIPLFHGTFLTQLPQVVFIGKILYLHLQ